MRRSALTDGTPGAASRATRRLGRNVRWAAGVWLLLAAAAHQSSATSPPWSAASRPDDFTDGFRNPYDGTPLDGLHYDGDVTPEDYVIDQITAYLQRAQGRSKSRPEQPIPPPRGGEGRQQREGEAEDGEGDEVGGGYEDVLEEEGLLLPPPPKESLAAAAAREGHGLGFTYRFPERPPEQQGRPFAVNPSDPKYYTATVIGRGGGDGAPGATSSWDSMGESEARELEGGGPPARPRPIRPLGRFPVIKPIKVVSTTGTESPIHDVEEMTKGASAGGGEGEEGGKAADLRMSHESAGYVPQDGAGGGSSVPAEQVKRERPEKVPLNFGSDAFLTAVISGCIAAAVVGVLAFAIFWYRLQRRNAKAAADVEYPAYGVTGPNQEASAVAAASSAVSPTPHSGGSTSPLTTGDRRLAQSAQMYHYQHQKQQIIAMESRASNERRGSVSEVDSEEENEEGDYTVYECPGLAPTGEMEVKNPLFHDDPTPATPSGGNNGRDKRGDGGGGKP